MVREGETKKQKGFFPASTYQPEGEIVSICAVLFTNVILECNTFRIFIKKFGQISKKERRER